MTGRRIPNWARTVALTAATTGAVLGFFAVIRLAYPNTPGLGPSTPIQPATSTAPEQTVSRPARPTMPGPWVVLDIVEMHCCDTTGSQLRNPVPAVRCLPAAEYRTRPQHPHYWLVPLKGSMPGPDEEPLYHPGEDCPGVD
ncbi:MAG TPA: hypothetical protein VG674_09585 [Amycolatopsis sp.]|nr:hypothetical protein [Amycolatopsis sp.]